MSLDFILPTLISGFAVLVSLYTWRRTHDFERDRLAREESWRREDQEREDTRTKPRILVEQHLSVGTIPGTDYEGLYLTLVAKNLGSIPVSLSKPAAIELIDPGINPRDIPENYTPITISGPENPYWCSPETFPCRIEPNESCSTFIAMAFIERDLELHQATRNSGIGLSGVYEDRVGRRFRPDHAIRWPLGSPKTSNA